MLQEGDYVSSKINKSNGLSGIEIEFTPESSFKSERTVFT